LKKNGLFLPAAAVLLAAIAVASSSAQAPPPPGPGQHMTAPKPTNLKVLPKDLTGEQVHEIMHNWAGMLGTECTHCHAEDPVRKMPNGKPALNFPDDSKKEKETARLMLKMTMEINANYVSMVEDAKTKVNCGTCHRGHVKPEAFVPKHDDDHDHHDDDHHDAPK